MTAIEEKGSCYCGAIEFTAKGSLIFSGFCHCKMCSRISQNYPVHLLGLSPPESFVVTKGADKMKTFVTPPGKFSHDFCSECGTTVSQGPVGGPFRALFPVNFKHEDGVSQKLPAHLEPKFHLNYENRVRDIEDDLPKFKAFDSGPKMDNKGNILA
mmetsp:Transcript_25414/g.49636  ORF Transcript_25414/g.49636 Transcript_25414/m.49636 type:complete len:156 (-) Transcript_25414:37-504(-)|eukprot:CAMPEP_0173390848 /NCGR_PEP_ID=MMETSP1356-20130122/16353_1 /TAXON_ID=77927 ORGANISM="Hemiselmis virescens, Strain PCC157" /NCGR_SAMPLE_ID=MMETSP1356 /ASSEMBLY_ACC=CAM_ASM_000847 /LENGTH=155 /DNA_ID=CAMNT_0014348335 /DNA_START=68 /DNA_END=535 /DNA_ORIENTATION=+